MANPNSLTTARSLPEKDTGVLPISHMYLHLPSEFAKQALFYAPYVGHFFCTKAYSVNRENYDYYLLLLMDSGTLEVKFDGQTFTAQNRDIVLIDCKKPHAYRALENISFRYFHFDGVSSRNFYEVLTKKYGYLLHPKQQVEIEWAMNRLISYAYDGLQNEHKISTQIHTILSELVMQGAPESEPQQEFINQAISYLEQHFMEDISVDQLAGTVGLSSYYFSRLFRKYTGDSPHAYLIRLRVTLARQLLASTVRPVGQIGESCGFNSTQHFIRCFREKVGCTPFQYRLQTGRREKETPQG